MRWNSLPTANGASSDLVLGQPGFASGEANTMAVEAATLRAPVSGFTDGKRLFVADPGANRVLIWNSLLAVSGQPADLVLGQADFTSQAVNRGGDAGAATLSTPWGVCSNGTKLAVADTVNSRVLVWNSFPTANGQAADLVLGQADFTSNQQNRGGALDAGTLMNPQGVWTDGTRLVVADSNNSRVLLWNAPPTGNGQAADLVLGQADFTSRFANRGVAAGAATLKFPYDVFSDGVRLFVADNGNNRVLLWNRLPESSGQAADLVLGQADFISSGYNRNSSSAGAGTLAVPSGVSSDGTRLFVADSVNHRVLSWKTVPAANGANADGVLGQPDFTSRTAGNAGFVAWRLQKPEASFTDGTRLFVSDTTGHRVLIWNSLPTADGQRADLVLGQADFTSFAANRGGGPGAGTFSSPKGVCWDGTRLLVADLSNHRVLVWNSLPAANGQPADLVLGQADFTSKTANRGGSPGPGTLYLPIGVFSDGTRLHVADKNNSRVLVWTSLPATNGQPADLVLGQADFVFNVANRGGDPGAGTLSYPTSVYSDRTRLFVADTSNHRVLLWRTPPTANGQPADAVLGRASFTGGASNGGGYAGAGTLNLPSGVFASGTRLFVADPTNHRVLGWNSLPAANGQPADLVLGQASFTASQGNRGGTIGAGTLLAPYGLSSDGTRLFVADTYNDRVVRYDLMSGTPADPPVFTINADRPTVALAYSKPSGAVGAGSLIITATFSDPIVTTPTLAIAGVAAPNSQAAANMTRTADAKVWTFVKTIAAGADGQATVTIANAFTASNTEAEPATNAVFTIDATAPVVTLAYSRAATAIGTGPLIVTATFSEPLVTTPTLGIAESEGSPPSYPMTPTADARVWLYGTTVLAGTNGQAMVVIANGRDAAGNWNQPATNSFLTFDTTRPTVALAYSKPGTPVGPGPLVITATFSESLVTTPTLALGGVAAPNAQAATDMTRTADPMVWTFVKLIASGADGLGYVTIEGGRDAAGNVNAAATNDLFTVDTTPPTVSLAYSQPSTSVGDGELVITATFSEPIASTPTLAVEAPGGANDLAAAAMTATADRRVWTRAMTISLGAGLGGSAEVSIAGASDATGNALGTPPTNATFTIRSLAPASLLRIAAVSTAAAVVSRGQSGVSVAMTVVNTTAHDVSVTAAGLTFNGSTGGYTVTVQETLPFTVSGNTTATFHFTVDVPVNAGLGLVTLDGTVRGRDLVTNDDVSPRSGAALTGRWLVQLPPALRVVAITPSKSVVERGLSGLTVTVSVFNDGTQDAAAARDLAASLAFNGSTAGYTVTPRAANPTVLATATSADLVYDVVVGAAAPLGPTAIAATVTAKDVNSLAPVPVFNNKSASWSVVSPPALLVASLAASRTVVARNQTGILVSLGVTHTGAPGAVAPISGLAATLRFNGSTTGYTISAAPANATTLAAGASTVLTYVVAVGSSAPAGDTTVTALVTCSDALTSQTAPVMGNPGTSWFVRTEPSLVVTSLSASASTVTPGQRGLTVEVSLRSNDPAGSGQGLEALAASLLFNGSPSGYTVTPAQANPATLAAGATAVLTFTVDVADSATPGNVDLTAVPAARYAADHTDASAGGQALATWRVVGPAALVLGRVSARDAQGDAATVVRPGQAGLLVTLEASNPGGCGLDLESAALTFSAASGSRAADYRVRPEGTNAKTLSAGGSALLTFVVDIDAAAPAGRVTLNGTATGTDTNSRASLTATTATTPAEWLVRPSPARLSIASVSTTTGAVLRGQIGLQVTVSASNTGQATAVLSAVSLLFSRNGADASAGYAVVPAASNATTLSGGASTQLRFSVDVKSTALTGTTTLDAALAASDPLNQTDAGSTGAASPAHWTVSRPAALALTLLEVPPAASRGGTFPVTLTVSNSGDSPAELTAAALTFARAAGGDAGGDFTVRPHPGNPSSLAAGRSVRLLLEVDVASTATPGPVDVKASVTAHDRQLLTDASDPGTGLTPARVQILQPATLRVLAIASPATAGQGQSVTVTMTVRNTGESEASISAAALSFLRNSVDSSGDFTVTPGTQNPVALAGGETAAFLFKVRIAPTAAAGLVTLDGSVQGSDSGTGAPAGDTGADATAPLSLFVVSSRPEVTAVSTAAFARRATAFAVTVHVRNSGTAAAQQLRASLAFQTAGDDVTGQYRVTARAENPASLAVGSEGDLVFDVAAGSDATPGTVAVRASLSGVDGFTSGALSAVGDTSFVMLKPAALEVTRVAAPASAKQGSSFKLSVTVRNSGDDAVWLDDGSFVFTGGSAADVTAPSTRSWLAAPTPASSTRARR